MKEIFSFSHNTCSLIIISPLDQIFSMHHCKERKDVSEHTIHSLIALQWGVRGHIDVYMVGWLFCCFVCIGHAIE